MGAVDSSFTGSIPRNYDRYLGPNIFVDYAADLASRVAAYEPASILELAAGTGIVSQKIAERAPVASFTITDLNEDMLAIAAEKVGPRVKRQVADAMNLPFEADSFDIIACQFGVMFFPDKAASFSEARRVLKPGGRYVFNVWAKMARNPFSETAFDAGSRFLPDNPPQFYKVPFSYPDPEIVVADLKAGGFAHIEFEVLDLEKPVANWRDFAKGLVHGNPLSIELQAGGVDPDQVVEAIGDALILRFGEGGTMPLQALVFTAG
ncbi:methyltransferase domain-containing protein [Hyphobacterium sp. HN65]|uniref:Methyltransferase domain-containing protein n=1 Tax=Hyphobacterium lacteum TaxID=3116575 RepID=A0ABU7LQA8_9PROT|nr:methyltransferase domain-containing protein [Hyphobacterium sp. HN65]MEE2526082.1 methyltransferase domain-containing protein [Hyphobacterium sp. HN65]